MDRKVFFVFLVIFLSISPSTAAIYKGQKYFKKECISCHKDQQSFVASKTISQWKKLFNKKGESLLKIHKKNDLTKNSLKYFIGKRFPKNIKHLKQFFVEYAKDSGNILAVN